MVNCEWLMNNWVMWCYDVQFFQPNSFFNLKMNLWTMSTWSTRPGKLTAWTTWSHRPEMKRKIIWTIHLHFGLQNISFRGCRVFYFWYCYFCLKISPKKGSGNLPPIFFVVKTPPFFVNFQGVHPVPLSPKKAGSCWPDPFIQITPWWVVDVPTMFQWVSINRLKRKSRLMFQRAESLIGGDSSKSSMKSKSFEKSFLVIFRFGILKVPED